MSDFAIFYNSATCWLQGIDPYTCEFIYPLPILFFFLPFTAFSLPIAKILWLSIGLLVIVVIFKRQAIWHALYVPVLQCFILGQVDLFFLPALFIRDGISMALLTLKPQLIWLYLPFWFWQADRRQRVRFIATASIIWLGSFLVWPGWLAAFTTRSVGLAIYASPSLFGGWFIDWRLVLVAGVILAILARNKLSALTVVNPFIQSYDLIVLLPRGRWWIVPLSWLCQALTIKLGLAFPHALLGLSIAIDDFWRKRR